MVMGIGRLGWLQLQLPKRGGNELELFMHTTRAQVKNIKETKNVRKL